MTLDWKYCACGCHGHYVSVNNNNYWLYNDLNGGFHLYRGNHGEYSEKIGKYSGLREAHKVVKELLKGGAQEIKNTLEEK